MKVRYLRTAEYELDDAYVYYQSEQKGLGIRFVSEVTESIARICEFPESYPTIGKHSRRCLIHKFPYGIIYQHSPESILVIAIAHLNREPDYWISRDS